MRGPWRSRSPDSLPLYGVPFAVKDNIDLEGVVTTAACPDYAYMPATSAYVVQRLIDAGAIPVGKTNLDQFATGTRGHALALRRVPEQRESGVRSRAVPARSPRLRWRRASSASRSARTRRARVACPPRSTTSWGSSPRAGD